MSKKTDILTTKTSGTDKKHTKQQGKSPLVQYVMSGTGAAAPIRMDTTDKRE